MLTDKIVVEQKTTVDSKKRLAASTTYHCKLTDEDRETGCMEVELAKGRYLRNGDLPLR